MVALGGWAPDDTQTRWDGRWGQPTGPGPTDACTVPVRQSRQLAVALARVPLPASLPLTATSFLSVSRFANSAQGPSKGRRNVSKLHVTKKTPRKSQAQDLAP